MASKQQVVEMLERIDQTLSIGIEAKALSEKDSAYAHEYIRRAVELNNKGRFAEAYATILRTSEWDDFNFRGGVKSIRGFHGELASVITINTTSSEVAFLAPENKQDQIDGIDLHITHPAWQRDAISVQVKTVRLKEHNDAFGFFMYEEWLDYKPSKVDRFIITDPDEPVMFMVDYPALRAKYALKLYNACREQYVSSLFIPVVDLLTEHTEKFLKLRMV